VCGFHVVGIYFHYQNTGRVGLFVNLKIERFSFRFSVENKGPAYD